MTDILEEIGIILRTHGKELNPFSLPPSVKLQKKA